MPGRLQLRSLTCVKSPDGGYCFKAKLAQLDGQLVENQGSVLVKNTLSFVQIIAYHHLLFIYIYMCVFISIYIK